MLADGLLVPALAPALALERQGPAGNNYKNQSWFLIMYSLVPKWAGAGPPGQAEVGVGAGVEAEEAEQEKEQEKEQQSPALAAVYEVPGVEAVEAVAEAVAAVNRIYSAEKLTAENILTA